MRRLKTIAIAAVLAIAACSTSYGQSVKVEDGEIIVRVRQPAAFSYGRDGRSLTIYWGDQPPPIPPGPTPVPPGPGPTPPPIPVTWGPLAKIIVYYENDARKGGEVYASQPFRDALTEVSPKDSAGHPYWRIWDDDAPIAETPEWVEAAAKVMAKRGAATVDPVLYAVDAQGRIKETPLKDFSDANAIAAVRELGAAK